MKQEPGRQQPGISGLQAGEDVKRYSMVQSFKIREHSELLVDDKCGTVVNIDIHQSLPVLVCIGNLFGDSIMIDEDEWEGFVRLVNAADARIKEANRENIY